MNVNGDLKFNMKLISDDHVTFKKCSLAVGLLTASMATLQTAERLLILAAATGALKDLVRIILK